MTVLYATSRDDLPLALLDRLEQVIRPRGQVMTAYSGGIDSTLVALVARRTLGKANAPAVIGDSLSLPRRELRDATALAVKLDLELITLKPTEQDDPNYRANAGDRCYFCKSNLYTALHAQAKALGVRYIANGTNTDDLGDHRPGLKAADEAEVISPLLEAGLDKSQVRLLAEHLALPNADKPAAACLASRLPYGTRVTPERLAMVEQAEDALIGLGLTGLRVRYHGQVARIELPEAQLKQLLAPNVRLKVVEAVKSAGFLYVALDLEGFRSGSGNIALTVDGTTPGR